MEIGPPQSDVLLVLLKFNLGVVAGQLLFIAVVLAAYMAVLTLVVVPIGLRANDRGLSDRRRSQ